MDREFLGRGRRNSTLVALQGVGLTAALWIGSGGSVAVSAEEPARLSTSNVVVNPQPDQPFSARWSWAVQEASRRSDKRGAWIGYGVRKRMAMNQFIGNWSMGQRQWLSLNEIVYGVRAPTDPRSGEQGNTTIWKTVGILLRFNGDKADAKSLDRVEISGTEWHVELGRFPLLWAGDAEDAESLAVLQQLYSGSDVAKVREALVEAFALHSEPDLVVPVLQSILTKDSSDRVRAEAAESLGEFDDPRSVQILRKAIQEDRSRRVREEAVEAIGEMSAPEATAVLEELATTGDDRRVREEAIESLVEQAPPERSVAAMEKIAFEDTYEDLQEKAVEQLADLPRSLTLPILRKVAETHPSRSIRVKALEQLAESAPPAEAAALFEKIVFEDTYEELQEGAVEAMGQLPQAQAIPSLQKVVDKHPSEDIRDKAVDALLELLPTAESARLLEKVAQDDPSSDLRKGATGALADLPASSGLPIAKKLASSHEDAEVRQEALEVITRRAPAAEALAELQKAAREDRNGELQEQAVDYLAHLSTPESFAVLADLARTHPRPDVRERALESLAGQAPPAQVAALAEEMAFKDSSEDVQEQAVETLAELPQEFGLEPLIRVAKTHQDPDCRSEAVQHLGKSQDARARKIAKDAEHDEEDEE